MPPSVEQRISVALCTFNGAAFLPQQIASILGQTLSPHEIVLSDDASTDSSVDIVGELIAVHNAGSPRTARVKLKVLKNDRPLGISANFQQAVTACSGEFIALSDQDDFWAADRLELLIGRILAAPHLSLVHHDARLVDAEGKDLGRSLFQTLGVDAGTVNRIHAGDAFDELLRRNLVTGATVVFRRALLDRALPIPRSWLHDEWLAVIAAAEKSLDVVEHQLIGYRQHGGNAIGIHRLTPSAAWRRLTEPGTRRNQRLLERAEDLKSWTEREYGSGDRRTVMASEKFRHELARSSYAGSRFVRLISVLREWSTSRYSTFGGGARDLVRDLIQPLPKGDF